MFIPYLDVLDTVCMPYAGVLNTVFILYIGVLNTVFIPYLSVLKTVSCATTGGVRTKWGSEDAAVFDVGGVQEPARLCRRGGGHTRQVPL